MLVPTPPRRVNSSQDVSPCSRILINGQVDCTIGGLSNEDAHRVVKGCHALDRQKGKQEYREAAQMWEQEGCNRSLVGIIIAIVIATPVALFLLYLGLARVGCCGKDKKQWAEEECDRLDKTSGHASGGMMY